MQQCLKEGNAEDSITQNEADNLWRLGEIEKMLLLKKMSLVIWFGGQQGNLLFSRNSAVLLTRCPFYLSPRNSTSGGYFALRFGYS